MIQDESAERVIAAIIQVHKALGPGLPERIYQRALAIELREAGFVELEKPVPIQYKGLLLGRYRVDLLVDRRLVIEVKNVRELDRFHDAQLKTYLRVTGNRLGLLVNFAGSMADFRRVEIS